MTAAARILLIANKWFEADPLMDVLSNPDARSPSIVTIDELAWPRIRQTTQDQVITKPRCQIALANSLVEVWCIEDLMTRAVSHSSTSEKQKALDTIFAFGRAPAAVIAFGTGTHPTDISNNGNISIGGSMFLHQPTGPANPNSNWEWKNHMEQIVPSNLAKKFFSDFRSDAPLLKDIVARCLVPRILPAPALGILVGEDAVAISSVNIVSNKDYDRVDAEAIALAKTAGATDIASIETTHGVIRAQSEAPFLFVTGIPNRLGKFTDEAFANYPQNFVAAHNAGVVASYLLPRIVALVGK